MADDSPRRGRVFLVEDHPALREGIALILARDGWEVAGDASSEAGALAAVGDMALDAVVADLSLEDGSGIAFVRALFRARPDLPVVVYSVHEDVGRVSRAFEAGARGYVTKREDPSELLRCMREVAAGRTYASPRAGAALVHAVAGGIARRAGPLLSRQEHEVYRLLGRGYATPEIARRLGIGPRTIETYYDRLLVKLDLASRRDLRVHAAAARVEEG
jgi:DNA-binding NarL/FixJ family response regulator